MNESLELEPILFSNFMSIYAAHNFKHSDWMFKNFNPTKCLIIQRSAKIYPKIWVGPWMG